MKFLSFAKLLFASVFFLACSDENSSASSEHLPSSSSENAGTVQESSSSLNVLSSSIAEEIQDSAWSKAKLTWYESYPEEGSEECVEYNGCEWAGWFAGLEEQQTPEWVAENNIIAVHEKDWETYALKKFRLRKNGHEIDAVVYDMCSDADCDGCCTKNAGSIGFLIDIEVNTKARFGNQGSGIVEWMCLDCD